MPEKTTTSITATTTTTTTTTSKQFQFTFNWPTLFSLLQVKPDALKSNLWRFYRSDIVPVIHTTVSEN